MKRELAGPRDPQGCESRGDPILFSAHLRRFSKFTLTHAREKRFWHRKPFAIAGGVLVLGRQDADCGIYVYHARSSSVADGTLT